MRVSAPLQWAMADKRDTSEAALRERLTPEHFLYNLGTLSRFTDRRDVTPNGMTPQETIAHIRENKSWIVLKHVEADAVYRELVDEVWIEFDAVTSSHPRPGRCPKSGPSWFAHWPISLQPPRRVS